MVSSIGLITGLSELFEKASDSVCAGYKFGGPLQKIGCTALNIAKGIQDGAESFSPIPDPIAMYEQVKYVFYDGFYKNIYDGYLKKVTTDEFVLTDCLASAANAALIAGKRYIKVHFKDPAINLFSIATFRNIDFGQEPREIAKSFTESALFYTTLFLGGRGKVTDTVREARIRGKINDPANLDLSDTVAEVYNLALAGDKVSAEACKTAKIDALVEWARKYGENAYTSEHTALRWLAEFGNEAAMKFLADEVLKNSTARAQILFEATSPLKSFRQNAINILNRAISDAPPETVKDIIKKIINISQVPELAFDGHTAVQTIAELHKAHVRIGSILLDLSKDPKYKNIVIDAIASTFD